MVLSIKENIIYQNIKDRKMRKLIALGLFSLLVFFGCNQESDITSPTGNNTTQEPNWLVSLTPNGLGTETIHSASALINGAQGGSVNFKGDFPGGPFGKVHVDSKLVIHSGSFTGSMVISTYIDDVNFLTTFGPSYIFNQPLEYTLLLQGLDLTGVNPDSVKFVYQASDGSIHECESDGVDVDLNKGKLKVNKAKIPHFSRYGFVN
jgi:hypothetical protein